MPLPNAAGFSFLLDDFQLHLLLENSLQYTLLNKYNILYKKNTQILLLFKILRIFAATSKKVLININKKEP